MDLNKSIYIMRMETIFTVFTISDFFRKDVMNMKRNKVFINTDGIVILALVASLTIAIIYGEKDLAQMIASSLLSYVAGIEFNQTGYWK